MQWRNEICYLVLATILTRLLWMFMVPMSEAPDENTHLWVIRFLADHLRLPTPLEITQGGRESVYGSIPPLGYLPHVPALWCLSPVFDSSMAARFGSLLIAPIMTVSAWLISKQLFSQSKICALAVPLLVVFHPQLVLMFSYSNSEVTSSTLATIVLLVLVQMLKKGLSIRLSFLLGFLTGWLLLTKYSGYAVLPAVAIAVIGSAWIHRVSIKKFLTAALCFAGTAIALSLWWFVRNYQLFNGDILGIQTMRRQWAIIYNRPLQFYRSPFEIALDYRWWRFLWFSYWGHFGYLTRPLWRPLYFVYAGFLVAGLFGCLKALLETLKASQPAAKEHQSVVMKSEPTFFSMSNRQPLIQPAIWLTMAVCLISNLAAMIWSTVGNVGGPKGQYLLTSEVPVLSLMVAGLFLIGRRWGPRLVVAFVSFNLIVYVWAFVMLFQIYGFRWKA